MTRMKRRDINMRDLRASRVGSVRQPAPSLAPMWVGVGVLAQAGRLFGSYGLYKTNITKPDRDGTTAGTPRVVIAKPTSRSAVRRLTGISGGPIQGT